MLLDVQHTHYRPVRYMQVSAAMQRNVSCAAQGMGMWKILGGRKEPCDISKLVVHVQDRDNRRRDAGLKPFCHFVNSFFVCKLYQYVLTNSCVHIVGDLDCANGFPPPVLYSRRCSGCPRHGLALVPMLLPTSKDICVVTTSVLALVFGATFAEAMMWK